MSNEQASPAGAESESPDKENQRPPTLAGTKRKHSLPTLTFTDDQVLELTQHPTVELIVRQNLEEEEKAKISEEMLKESVSEEMLKESVDARLMELVDARLKEVGYDTLKSEHETLKSEHETLKSEHDNLKDLVFGVILAFAPVTRIAIYECAVYKFVGAVDAISSNPNLGLIRHQMVRLCNCVMVMLRKDFNEEQKSKMEFKAVTNMVGNDQVKLRVVLEALQGLKAYVDLTEKDEVKAWNLDERNNLPHGGSFLKCLLAPSSTDKYAMTKYTAEVDRVKKFENGVKAEAKKRGYPEELASIERAVLDIRAALEGKDVLVVEVKSAKKVVKKVQQATCTKGEDATASQSDKNNRGDDDSNNTQGFNASTKKDQKKNGKGRQQKGKKGSN